MIDPNHSRVGRIGGSDAKYLYSGRDTYTFSKWWMEKLGLINPSNFNNIYTAVGTILEEVILDRMGIPLNCRNLNFKLEGTIAAVSTDAFQDGILHEAKTIKNFDKKGKIPLDYKRQLIHGAVVTGATNTVIHFLLVNDYDNLFNNADAEIISIDFEPSKEEIDEHMEKIMYFTKCYDDDVWPT